MWGTPIPLNRSILPDHEEQQLAATHRTITASLSKTGTAVSLLFLLAKQNTSEMREKESFMQKKRVGGLFLFPPHSLFLGIFK